MPGRRTQASRSIAAWHCGACATQEAPHEVTRSARPKDAVLARPRRHAAFRLSASVRRAGAGDHKETSHALTCRPLEQLDLDAAQTVGGPLMIPIADIDEDPDQPRLEFDDEPLKELAATIAERGVRSPVSVRPHPSSPGRWLLNYGARRLRAAKLAGLSELPAFEDKSADSYDQVIENEQREGLEAARAGALREAPAGQGRVAGGDRQATRQEPDVHHLCPGDDRSAALADGGLSIGQVPQRSSAVRTAAAS